MMDFQPDEQTYTTPCNHVFHASCIAEAWRFDPRCPSCRDCPTNINPLQRFQINDDPGESSDSDSDEERYTSVTLREALRIGKCMKSNNAAVKKSFTTLTKWNKLKKKIQQSQKHVRNTLKASEADVEARTERFRDRLEKIHLRKHRSFIEQDDELRKQLQRAESNIWATKMRIAKKCGYETPSERIRRIIARS
tara:strand:+ start:316 stop:897 length:582 start_codon:yes stop_codon:yes gene_type:complete